MFFSVFSAANPVIAAEVQEKEEAENSVKTLVENLQEENKTNALTEIIDERDRYTKVFKTNNGTKKAVVSATPIHYKENGEWLEIDNTLIDSKDDDCYSNRENSFTASIPKELSAGSEIKLEKEGYSIVFELAGTDIFEANNKSKGKKKEKKSDEIFLISNNIDFEFSDKQDSLTFENIGENTSVEYSVIPTGIKENIILNKQPKTDVIYNYKITAEKLKAELNTDNSVTFTTNAGSIIFEIPAPIMYDSKGNVSCDIEVALVYENSTYILTYKPSYEWLKNTAKYPVVIDPVINTLESEFSLADSSVSDSDLTGNYGNTIDLYTGYLSNNEYISYIDISGNRILDCGLAIKNVSLYLYTNLVISPSNIPNFEVAAYPIVDKWSESEITYSDKPSLDTSILLDKRAYDGNSSGRYSVYDVTEAFTSNSNEYNGIALTMACTDTTTDGCVVIFAASEYGDTARCPYFVVEYYETQGVEEQFDYHVQNAGRAGTVYYNDFSNQIYIERDELGLPGLTMPVQIKRYYNSNTWGSFSLYNLLFFGAIASYGFGWKTNYNQSIEYAGLIDGKEHILYNNDQGQTIYFAKSDTIENGKRKWVESADIFSNEKGYELWFDTAYESDLQENIGYASIKDSANQTYEFNEYGLLRKIHSGEEDLTASITVTYTDDLNIAKVVDGVGREFRFSYTEYENAEFSLLTAIQAYTASGNAIKLKDANNNNVDYKITYQYTFNIINGRQVPILSSATYPDGESVYYDISDSTTTVKNIDGYTLEYVFSNVGNCTISEKVYLDGSAEPILGGSLGINKDNTHQKTFTDENNVTQTKQFDIYGRTINVINNDGTFAPRTYSDESKATGRLYNSMYIDYETEVVTEGENLVDDGSFDIGLSAWLIADSSRIKRVTDIDSNPNANVTASLYFDSAPEDYQYAIQSISVPNGVSGDNYRISFATKYDEVHQVENISYVSAIYIYARLDDNTWKSVANIFPNPFNNNWQKNSYDFSIDFEYNEIEINIIHCCQYGRAWYDDFSLINTYKPTVNTSSDNSSSSETSTNCSCSYCENNCNCTHSGTTECTPESCPDCGECTCDGCTQLDCPCRNCSETCDKVYCNRSYTYESSSEGTWFTLSDGEKEMRMSQTVNDNYYGSQSDMNGISTFYNYNQTNGQLLSTTNSNDYVTSYSYDAMSRLKNVTTSVSNLSNGNSMTTSYGYDNDRIENITHNGFSYNYEYDAWGNATSVKVGQQPLVNYSYGVGENRNRINRITYGNGDYIDYTYADNGNITAIKSYSDENTVTADYEYTYDENGNVSKIKNVTENTEVRYTENNTSIVLLNGEGETDDVVLYSTEINEDGETIENLGGIMYNKGESTTSGDVEKGTTTLTSDTTSPSNRYDFISENDYFGRQTKRELSKVISDTNNVKESLNFQTSYDYKNYSGNRTSSLISSYRAVLNRATETVADETKSTQTQTLYDWEYLYTYDTNGNIVDLSVNIPDDDYGLENVSICSYVYDEAGQLVRENNAYTEKSYVYVYDKGGNITQKIVYEYSEETLAEPISTVNYTYDTAWKDKLTAYGDTSITADAIGNPLNLTSVDYLGNKVDATLEWNGRQLSAIIINGQRIEYTYDSSGMRTKMTVYNTDSDTVNTVYYYIWNNGKLLGYIVTDANGATEHTVKMLFDNTNDSVGYELYSAEDNTTKSYFFLKNLQGDITNVFNENGDDVLQYAYDAWGNVTAIFDKSSYENLLESAEAVVFTPITYRGYMYDQYSGLYYLQSRYYNPLYGRFLNMDDTSVLEQTTGKVHGANLFAYCNNDPINNTDYTGMFVVDKVAGLVLTFLSLFSMLVLFGIFIILMWYIINPSFFQIDGIALSLREVISKWRNMCIVLRFQLVDVTLGSLIRDIDSRLTKYKYRRGQQEHHIVPQKIFFYKGTVSEIFCSHYLTVSGIDVQSPFNRIWLNASFHSALNTNIYYSAVYELTKNFYEEAKEVGVYFALLLLRIFLSLLNYLYMLGNGGVI